MCCKRSAGLVILVLGLLYLLQDIGVLIFSLNPWSIIFILGGFWLLFGKATCCAASCCQMPEATPVKKAVKGKKK